ncbi:MAG: uroporphyrinogen-III C-methyltransferase, partial [Proteobacteria bacterium]|nr:uroporphyrinogen-III C-methyltransferase [Pseudomonadota bacterium]
MTRAAADNAAASAATRPGHVTLVGAGPGAADLLTVRAIRALRQATVVLVDDLVDAAVLRYVRPSARIVHCGKRGGAVSTQQGFIEAMLVTEALHGERVVRLKGGDPYVFGRGGEEAAALRAAGVAHTVVPGITAGIAAPAEAGIPVTDRRWAQGVLLVTGHAQPGHAGPDWAQLAQTARGGITLVIYMGITHSADITAALMAAGLPGSTPAAVVQSGCTPQQRAHVGTLRALAGDIRRLGMGSPAILVIGDVVRAAALMQDG